MNNLLYLKKIIIWSALQQETENNWQSRWQNTSIHPLISPPLLPGQTQYPRTNFLLMLKVIWQSPKYIQEEEKRNKSWMKFSGDRDTARLEVSYVIWNYS